MKIIFFLISLFLSISLYSTETLKIEEDKVYYFNEKIGFIEDKTNQLTIQEVRSSQFDRFFEIQKITALQPSFGFSSSSFWFKTKIINYTEKENYFLQISFPLLDHVEVYITSEQEPDQLFRVGDSILFRERPIINRNFIIPLKLKKEKEVSVYLKVNSKGSIQIPIQLYSSNLFIENNQYEVAGLGFYYGIFTIIILYNLFLFLSVRDKLYIYYILHVMSFTFWQAAMDGLGYQLIWQNYPILNNIAISIGLCLLSITSLLFAHRFLNIESKLNSMNVAFYSLISSAFIISLFSFFIDFSKSISYAAIQGIISLFLIFQMIILKLDKNKKEYRSAWFYLTAWSSFFVGSIVLGLNRWGIMPGTFFIEHAQQIGAVIEIVVLSLALADRIKLIRLEKENAEKELLETRVKSLEFFSLFVPKQFLRFLQKESIFDIKLGDAVKYKMTILSSDIRDFTTISERMDPENNFKFINSYFAVMAKAIHDSGGFIDKFIGDAIIALFPENPNNAIYAALKMQEGLYNFNENRIEKGLNPIKIGIGLHYGEVILGTVGTQGRTDTTVVGDSIFVANFVESLTKNLKQPILLSEQLYTKLQKVQSEYKFELVDNVQFKESEGSFGVYKIIENKLIESITSPRMNAITEKL